MSPLQKNASPDIPPSAVRLLPTKPSADKPAKDHIRSCASTSTATETPGGGGTVEGEDADGFADGLKFTAADGHQIAVLAANFLDGGGGGGGDADLIVFVDLQFVGEGGGIGRDGLLILSLENDGDEPGKRREVQHFPELQIEF